MPGVDKLRMANLEIHPRLWMLTVYPIEYGRLRLLLRIRIWGDRRENVSRHGQAWRLPMVLMGGFFSRKTFPFEIFRGRCVLSSGPATLSVELTMRPR